MYFVRFFQTGIGGSDPRNRTVAVYKCEACGKEEWCPVSNKETFLKEPQRCPKCGSMGVDDLRKSLEGKRQELETRQAAIRAEIEKVISELNRLETVEQSRG